MKTILIIFLMSLYAGFSFAGEPVTPVQSPAKVKISLLTPEGLPTAAKLRILDTHSKPVLYEKGLNWLWVENPVELSLKSGSYSLLFKGGPRTQPLSKIINVAPNGLNISFQLKHYAPVSAAGWQVIDPYVQAGGITTDGYRYGSLRELSLAARCEGMKFIAADGLWQLADNSGNKFSLQENPEETLLSALNTIEQKGCTVASSSSVQRPGLGRFYTIEKTSPLAAQRMVGENFLYPSLAAVRERGGLSVISHPAGLAGGAQISRELVFDTLAGPLYDLIDISRGAQDIAIWHTLLNMGYRIPAVCGGPQNVGDNDVFPQPGCYVKLSREDPHPEHFIKSIAEGKSIASNGPFLRFFVENPSDKEELSLQQKLARASSTGGVSYISSKPRTIWLDAYACSDPRDSIKRIDLIYNGETIESAKGASGQKTMQLKWERVVLNRTGWLQVRYISQAGDLFAITNPVYVESPDSPMPLPVCSKITLSLQGRGQRKITGATVSADNLGAHIGSWKYTGKPLSLSLPATAEISVSAAGYAPKTIDIYTASGGRQYIESLYQSGTLSHALSEHETYEKMRTILENASINITLQQAH